MKNTSRLIKKNKKQKNKTCKVFYGGSEKVDIIADTEKEKKCKEELKKCKKNAENNNELIDEMLPQIESQTEEIYNNNITMSELIDDVLSHLEKIEQQNIEIEKQNIQIEDKDRQIRNQAGQILDKMGNSSSQIINPHNDSENALIIFQKEEIQKLRQIIESKRKNINDTHVRVLGLKTKRDTEKSDYLARGINQGNAIINFMKYIIRIMEEQLKNMKQFKLNKKIINEQEFQINELNDCIEKIYVVINKKGKFQLSEYEIKVLYSMEYINLLIVSDYNQDIIRQNQEEVSALYNEFEKLYELKQLVRLQKSQRRYDLHDIFKEIKSEPKFVPVFYIDSKNRTEIKQSYFQGQIDKNIISLFKLLYEII